MLQSFSIPNYIKAVLFASCRIKDLAAENMEDYIISNILDQDEEKKLTDFVMYMRTGEYELEETPVRCNWTFGDSIGCQNCEKCYVKSFCCRKAADNLLENLSR